MLFIMIKIKLGRRIIMIVMTMKEKEVIVINDQELNIVIIYSSVQFNLSIPNFYYSIVFW